MPKLGRSAVCVIVAVAVVVLGACSSGGSSSSGSSSAGQPSGGGSGGAGSPSGSSTGGGSGSAGSPISIGVMCSCSGAFGTTIVVADKVLQAWAKSVNDAGGLGGHPVNLVEKDNASNSATAVTQAQELIRQNVSLIFDLDILDVTWQKYVDAAKIPVVGGAFTSEPFYTDPNWYPSGQTNDSIVKSVVVTAKTAGVTKLGMLYCAESVQCQESVSPLKAAAKAAGVDVPYDGSIAATAPNYSAQCLAAKQAGADVLFIGASISIIARVAGDCDRQGYDPIYVTEGTGFTDQVLTSAGLKNKLWSEFPILPYFADSPGLTAMNTVLDKYFPGLRTNTTTWSGFAMQAWTGGLLLQSAAKNAGWAASDSVTSASWISGLDKVSGDTLGGLAPKLTFSAGKAHPVDCWFTSRVSGGVAKQVGGLTCS